MKVHIYYSRFLDPEGHELAIGGVETIIRHLTDLCLSTNRDVTIFQLSSRPFRARYREATVVGCPTDGRLRVGDISSRLRQAACGIGRIIDTIEVFASDVVSHRVDNPRALSIQHGVSWDLPTEYLTKRLSLRTKVGGQLMRLWLRAKALRQFENCPYRVCVDLNFLNWYKTFRGDAQTGCVWVIPNAAPAVAWLKDRETRYSPVRIIFARRFIPERGTRVIAEAIRSVLTRHPDVHVTFAGSGPEEAYLRSCFSAYPQVQICAYASPAAVQTHQCHDIAVVPSLASEGTTLSVVEAMSAGCAVVASAVGGITNQIVTGYNGVLVRPEAGCFASALDSLIRDHRLRLQIQRRAWETATAAFTIGRWREQWMEVLDWVEHNRSGVR